MIIKTVNVKFIEKIQRTSTVMSFRFQPVESADFIAGQFCQIIFDNQNQNNKDLNKYLSFSCAPNKEHLEITKRLSDSEFSTALKCLKFGDEVLLKMPLGQCVLKPEYKRIVFFAGGIGITPIVSMLEDIVLKKIDVDILLVYSSRAEKDIIFKSEIEYWQQKNPRIKVYYGITDHKPENNAYYHGPICQDMLMKVNVGLNDRVVFIFGPPKMVEAVQIVCVSMGYLKENIKIEKFVGY